MHNSKAAPLIMTILTIASLIGCKAEVTSGQKQEASEKHAATEKLEFGSPEVKSANGMLTVARGRINLCADPEGLVASEVRWDASSTGTEGAQVWLKEAGKEPVLWSESGARSASTTGKWLREGTEVILINAEDKVELARIKIEAVPCN